MEAATQASAPPEYCLMLIDHWSTCMTKAEWSGWMQAFGSLVAIGIAVAVPVLLQKASERRERQLALDEEAKTVSILASIIDRSATSLAEAMERLRAPMDSAGRAALREFTSKQFDGLAATMKAVPILHLADGPNAQAWLMVNHKLESVADSFRKGIESEDLLEAVHGLASDAHEMLQFHISDLHGRRAK